MIALKLIAVFLAVGWLTLVSTPLLCPESITNSEELILCAVMGLTAVVIVSTVIITDRIKNLHILIENNHDDEQENEKS